MGPAIYKINTHDISGVQNKANNPDWRVVMANYVCMSEAYANVFAVRHDNIALFASHLRK